MDVLSLGFHIQPDIQQSAAVQMGELASVPPELDIPEAVKSEGHPGARRQRPFPLLASPAAVRDPHRKHRLSQGIENGRF